MRAIASHKNCYRSEEVDASQKGVTEAGHPKGGTGDQASAPRSTPRPSARRYLAAERAGKGRILEEYCRTLRCHRKAAIRALRSAGRRPRRRAGRRRARTIAAVVPALERLRRVSDRLCGKLLAPALPTLAPRARAPRAAARPRRTGRQLLALSPATLDRLPPAEPRPGWAASPIRAAAGGPARSSSRSRCGPGADWRRGPPGRGARPIWSCTVASRPKGFSPRVASWPSTSPAAGSSSKPIWGVGAVRVGRRRAPPPPAPARPPARVAHRQRQRVPQPWAAPRYCRRHGIRVTRGRRLSQERSGLGGTAQLARGPAARGPRPLPLPRRPTGLLPTPLPAGCACS